MFDSVIERVRQDLLNMQDTAYRDFHSRLVPTLQRTGIIGVRTPVLRRYAKTLTRESEIETFLNDLPHKYYEENNLHAILIENCKCYDECLNKIKCFLPYIDNWATCDMLRPKCFKKNAPSLLPHVYKWIDDDRTYVKRFGIGMLNSFYLDEHFNEEQLIKVSKIESDEYYVKMMVAWYFATALAKQENTALIYLENKTLDKWTHNKAIQKAVESFRISSDLKYYLKTLRI